MKRALLAACLMVLASCAQISGMGGGWETVIEGGKGLENFDRVGDVNWRAEGDAIVADRGKNGHLVSKKSYGDFEMRSRCG